MLIHDIDKHQGEAMPDNHTKVTVRMPKVLHQALTEMADKDRRSFNAQLVVILERVARGHVTSQEKEAAAAN